MDKEELHETVLSKVKNWVSMEDIYNKIKIRTLGKLESRTQIAEICKILQNF